MPRPSLRDKPESWKRGRITLGLPARVLTERPPAEFRVESVQRELQQRPIDRNDLKIAAERAGGRLVPLSEIESLPDMIPPGAAVPLEYGTSLSVWQRSEPLLLLACLLVQNGSSAAAGSCYDSCGQHSSHFVETEQSHRKMPTSPTANIGC